MAPDCVAGLMLIGPLGPGKVALEREAVEPILSRANDVAFVRECFRPWFTVWPQAEFDRWTGNFAHTPDWAHRAVCEIALWTNISAETAGISAPALVIAGEHDPVYGPVYQREAVLPAIPHARMVTIDCGHGLILERPEEIAMHCEEFLEMLQPWATKGK
jgi:pimeloyl-ACP methyl ester carboxylesterase